MSGEEFPDSQGVTFQSRRQDESPPDVRLLHYNDVYHIECVRSEQSLIPGTARVVLIKIKGQDLLNQLEGSPDSKL